MKKTAVLLDLGFVLYRLQSMGKSSPTAFEIRDFAIHCLAPTEELFRIYCYHCLPYGDTQTHPLTRRRIDFRATAAYTNMNRLIQELKLLDNIAFRAGELSFYGWTIRRHAAAEIIRTGRRLMPDDFAPELKQKGVDMKIGLDVAWLATKQLVDRIVLVTADSDIMPAMKFARREGIQVILVTMGHPSKHALREHADELRSVVLP